MYCLFYNWKWKTIFVQSPTAERMHDDSPSWAVATSPRWAPTPPPEPQTRTRGLNFSPAYAVGWGGNTLHSKVWIMHFTVRNKLPSVQVFSEWKARKWKPGSQFSRPHSTIRWTVTSTVNMWQRKNKYKVILAATSPYVLLDSKHHICSDKKEEHRVPDSRGTHKLQLQEKTFLVY